MNSTRGKFCLLAYITFFNTIVKRRELLGYVALYKYSIIIFIIIII